MQHGRTQGMVDALAARTDLACSAIGLAQLAAVTGLDLHGHELAVLRAGDFAGLSALHMLDLSGHDLLSLPTGLCWWSWIPCTHCIGTAMRCTHLHTRYDPWRARRNDLSALPAGFFANLARLEYLDLSCNQLTALPAGLFGLLRLTSLDVGGKALPCNIQACVAHILLARCTASGASSCAGWRAGAISAGNGDWSCSPWLHHRKDAVQRQAAGSASP